MAGLHPARLRRARAATHCEHRAPMGAAFRPARQQGTRSRHCRDGAGARVDGRDRQYKAFSRDGCNPAESVSRAVVAQVMPPMREPHVATTASLAIEGNKLLVDFEKAGSKRVMDGFVQRA